MCASSHYPIKKLRENALHVAHMRVNAKLSTTVLYENKEMSVLIHRLDNVLKAHDGFMAR
ncbi:MAG: NAD(P) transhydrogenase [Candidatus Endobugula sp.]|jgi:NAD(P) transhydrogenase